MGTYAWRTYGSNWFQLEAPRHVFVHSRKSIELLAERTGFAVEQVVFDSSDFMFWASEQCVHDIPLRSPRSFDVNPSASIFTSSQIAEFKIKAAELNAKEDGDAAAFYLRKISDVSGSSS